MIAWVDLETTGLDPKRDRILEIAMLLTDDQLRVVSASWAVVDPWGNQEDAGAGMAAMDPYVHEMHNKNHLLREVWDEGVSLREAEDQMLQVMEGLTPGTVPMGGSSVHFDRAFLAEHLPELHGVFSHRNVDVSSTREMARRWSPGLMEMFDGWLDAWEGSGRVESSGDVGH